MIELKGTFSPVKVLKGNINAVSVGLASGMIPIPSTAEVGQILSVLAVDDEKKLTAVEAIDKPETPLFDLTSAGLPAITPDGVPVELETDTTEILAAVSKGAVVFKLNAQLGGEVIPANIVGTCICSNIGEETASVICPFVMDELGFVLLSVYPQRIEAVYMPHSMIAGSGGVSSWNDLTDKPFYEEVSTESLLEKVTFTSALAEEIGYSYIVQDVPFQLVIGETYSVAWGETAYECEAMDASTALTGAVYVGNGSGMDLPHNDEPFAIATVGTMLLVMCVADTAPTEHTVAISGETVTVKPMDAKFLPMGAIDERIEAYISAALEGDY